MNERSPGRERKYNVHEASEVAALIVGEQYGALDIVVQRPGRLDADGLEKLDVIRMGNRMYDPLCYLYFSVRKRCMAFKTRLRRFQREAKEGYIVEVLFSVIVPTLL